MDFDDNDIAGLGGKLASLELSDGEAAALREILDRSARADSDEVEGFVWAHPDPVEQVVSGPIPLPTHTAFALGRQGFILPGESENLA